MIGRCYPQWKSNGQLAEGLCVLTSYLIPVLPNYFLSCPEILTEFFEAWKETWMPTAITAQGVVYRHCISSIKPFPSLFFLFFLNLPVDTKRHLRHSALALAADNPFFFLNTLGVKWTDSSCKSPCITEYTGASKRYSLNSARLINDLSQTAAKKKQNSIFGDFLSAAK